MGTHPIFESDFDCLTECPPETQKLVTQPLPSTARLWLMANSKTSAWISSRANMLFCSFTHLISHLSAPPKSSHSLKQLLNSKKLTAKLSPPLQILYFLIWRGLIPTENRVVWAK